VSRSLVVACLLAALLPAGAAAEPAPSASVRETERVPLAGATWTKDSMPVPPPVITGEGADALVTLPLATRGERWGMLFRTDEAATARLVLDHRGGPDGVLYEVVLDGQRLTPARDAWRPSPRDLATDLGPVWLGAGGHLLEFVAREQPSGSAALRLRALELAWN
jgi:hypothetical protein